MVFVSLISHDTGLWYVFLLPNCPRTPNTHTHTQNKKQKIPKKGHVIMQYFFLTHKLQSKCNKKNRNENEMQRGMETFFKKLAAHIFLFSNQLLCKTCSTNCNQNLIKGIEKKTRSKEGWRYLVKNKMFTCWKLAAQIFGETMIG